MDHLRLVQQHAATFRWFTGVARERAHKSSRFERLMLSSYFFPGSSSACWSLTALAAVLLLALR
jgi:hypothetical protein